ncbi:sensor domain-containing diguanylate cyclase [Paenibacillus sacheonensis]|uniref:Diguanylate cyclase n=1 Tax=Paenibacillus sacheonensis TaxID=742054 RepID=A0A7X5C039_9BACL|nr:sensor domain-containing diguanylate cyclase [Paenibacillus sacheonensis]MBM7567553.1 diguanylate cyclase (GGDEF)-like protein/PAS domain S-box-containing protein [Paenibacillus sacheonensis]NBC71342.1 diguanylate cyclase [Paenibacillus sacheonensis]
MDIQLDQAPCGYVSISDTGIVRSVNQTFLDMLRYERDGLLGQHIESAMSVTNKLFFHTYFYPYIQLYGHVNEMYFSLRTSAREDVPVLLNGVRQERGGETVIDCVVLEMRKRIEYEKDMLQTKTKLEELYQATKEANEQLERLHGEYESKQQELMRVNDRLEMLASTDPLTGLRNRRFFQDGLLASLAAYRESGEPFSLLLFDIDHFKRINDTYGHPVGDLILIKLAELLRSLSRASDIVARYGGEEFVVLLPETDRAKALLAAERYCEAASSTEMDGYRITVSIGAATVSPEATEVTLVDQADLALYASKSGGRNRVTHFEQVPER